MNARPDVPLVWLKGEVKTPPFSAPARVEAGFLLRRLQHGESLRLPHSRPMPTVGPGCHELRIPVRGVTWRIIYYLPGDAVVVLDVFAKKTRTTPQAVLTSCAARLARFLAVTNRGHPDEG